MRTCWEKTFTWPIPVSSCLELAALPVNHCPLQRFVSWLCLPRPAAATCSHGLAVGGSAPASHVPAAYPPALPLMSSTHNPPACTSPSCCCAGSSRAYFVPFPTDSYANVYPSQVGKR